MIFRIRFSVVIDVDRRAVADRIRLGIYKWIKGNKIQERSNVKILSVKVTKPRRIE